ncbi:condensation domain-containing protein [Rhizobium changzhiense]|uniref:condensation domain-containing protein n=1 Tax=Rhizobium changzhiense TaxID=2692317 RepID=UPI001F0C6ADF|nr:condensation domain-containing protein [Rhizobium changzhiense]MCH4547467.1 condensation domain-containing protein [Rhizobium changzhiense]
MTHKAIEWTSVLLDQLTVLNAQLDALADLSGREQSLSAGAQRGDKQPWNDLSRAASSEALRLPMTCTQRQMWAGSVLNQTVAASFNFLLTCEIEKYDEGRLKSALMKVLSEQPILRSRPDDDGEFFVVKSPEQVANEISHARVRLASALELVGLATRELGAPFDMRSCLVRFVTVSLPKTNCILFVFHHLIMDGRSADLFLERLNFHYEGQESTSGDQALFDASTYIQWANRHASIAKLSSSKIYWEQLGIAPAVASGQFYRASVKSWEIPTALAERCSSVAAKHGATTFMLLCQEFAGAILDLTQAERLMLGIPLSRPPSKDVVTCSTDLGVLTVNRVSDNNLLMQLTQAIDPDVCSLSQAIDEGLAPHDRAFVDASITMEKREYLARSRSIKPIELTGFERIISFPVVVEIGVYHGGVLKVDLSVGDTLRFDSDLLWKTFVDRLATVVFASQAPAEA